MRQVFKTTYRAVAPGSAHADSGGVPVAANDRFRDVSQCCRDNRWTSVLDGVSTGRSPGSVKTSVMRTPTPEVEYVHKVGQVVFLVAYVEGMLIHDLPRFQIQKSAPPELHLLKVTGMTTRNLGEYIAAHAPKCTDPVVAAYLLAGGRALVEIAPQRNGMLHARPAEDGDDPNHPLRLLRWRVEGARPEDSEVFMISHDWLDRLIERIDDIVGELSEIRPPFGSSN